MLIATTLPCFRKGSDVIIVGRGITGSADVKKTASLYQQSGWEAYKKKLGH